MLTDYLRGSQNKRIVSDGLNHLPEYGKLASISREDVSFLIDWLIENNYILQTKGTYPVLHPTYNGQHYNEFITPQKLTALRTKMSRIANK